MLDELTRGNERFQSRRSQPSPENQQRPPFAAVLCCPDMPDAPETLFDQPPGNLLTLRAFSPELSRKAREELVSEVDRFHISLIVVLGHEGCSQRAAFDDDGGRWLARKLARRLSKELTTLSSGTRPLVVPAFHVLSSGEIELLDTRAPEGRR